MKRKWLAVGIILLFVATAIIPSFAKPVEKSSIVADGRILYVGGSGPGNYTRIQDAIDNASDGDTVFVYDDSSPYHEYDNVTHVTRSIILQGESWETTIIQVGMFNIIANNVIVKDFTFQNIWGPIITSSNNIIENCYFYLSPSGIIIESSGGGNYIRNCSFFCCWTCVKIFGGTKTEISYCNFNNSGGGGGYAIPGCILYISSHFLGPLDPRGTKIHHCNFTNDVYTITLRFRATAQIYSNNFMDNGIYGEGRVSFEYSLRFSDLRHNWWDTPEGPSICYQKRNDPIVNVREIDGADSVYFYFFFMPRLIEILGLYPWLSEPVPDAGRHL
jgi:hypothetical protein